MLSPHPSRRRFLTSSGRALASALLASGTLTAADATRPFRLRYILGSCLYGYAPLAEILPEVAQVGATAIDLWPQVHGNQREQLDELGEERFAALLREHHVRLGCLTQYKLGPFALQDEMRLAQRLGCSLIVTGAVGPKNLRGEELKQAVARFLEQMQPHLAVAEETGVTIAIENHGHNLIDSPEAIRWLLDLASSPRLGLALAPYHLPQDGELLAGLIRDAGERLQMFYAWQHGMGCMEKLPKEQELLQLPGRGDLDFGPLLAALREIDYRGWTEVFMHPVPRGIPILETTAAVTAEINRARDYLDSRLLRAGAAAGP
jgi:sugar phosphate isomerase/epimerase